MDSKKLTNIQRDVLREIGNIGAGNATTSMADLINQPVRMEVPSVEVVTINEMMELIGGPEKTIVAIFFRIKGEVSGTVYFILTIEEAEYLISKMTNNEITSLFESNGKETDAIALSVLQEIANILNGSYLSALADFTQLKMATTVPHLSIDMAAATLVSGLVELSKSTDYAILIDTRFVGVTSEDTAKGHFLLIPDPDSIPKLFKAIGIEV